MKHDLLAKSFQFLLYRRSSILQDIYFSHRIRRFVIFQSSPTRAIKKLWLLSLKINRMLISRLICMQWKFTTPYQLASPSKFCSLRLFFFSTTEVITFSKLINAFKPYNSWNDPFDPEKLDMGFLFYGHAVLQVEHVTVKYKGTWINTSVTRT